MPPHFMESRNIGHRFTRPGDMAERDEDDADEHTDWIDERSIAADSWSVKSEYGSTLDGEDPRHAEMDVINPVEDRSSTGRLVITAPLTNEPCLAEHHRTAEGSEDLGGQWDEGDEEEKGEQDGEEGSVLGLRSHWDSTYTDELANFHEHGQSGEIWFGETVMETSAEWTVRLAAAVASGVAIDPVAGMPSMSEVPLAGNATFWRTLDIGTGNGLLLHQLAKHGLKDLTGCDYCEAAVELARAVAQKAGLTSIQFLVDDILDSRLEGQYELVTDKGTLDAVKLHPDGVNKMVSYRKSVERVVAPGGLLVITSCNSTKDELIADIAAPNMKSDVLSKGIKATSDFVLGSPPTSVFEYVDHLRTYPTYKFGGAEGTRVCTVAFKRGLQ